MKLPLDKPPYYNTDNIANGIATDDMFDCYLEPVPGEGLITRRRPGLTQFIDLGTGAPGDGIYDWEAAEKVIAVSNGKVYLVTEAAGKTEILGLSEDESPLYSGANHVNWALGTGWQDPILNESADGLTKYTDYNALFETGALAKTSDGTGTVTPVAGNTTLDGVNYTVVITPYVTSGSATYTLGGTAGTTAITGTTTLTHTITTTSNEGLIITPTNTSRMVLRISWKANLATRDYPTAGIPVVFEDGQDTGGDPWLYMATGNLIHTEDGVTMATPLDLSAPSATHVAWINSRFVANEVNTNRFYFTDTSPITDLIENNYWSSSDNPVTCDSKGDKLSALFTAWQEIYAWGTQGLQVFQDDGVTPFVNVPGAAAEVGIEAIYSIKKIDNTIYALCTIDNKRVVIKLQGRAPQVISEPIASILSEMDTVSDAIGDVISVGGMAIYLLNFPTANQTWAYDYKNEIWLRWGYWDTDTGTHDRWIGQHSCFVKRWNKHLIMSRVDGKIYEMSRSVYDDADRDMVSYRRTGWIDWGDISKLKHSKDLFIKTKTFANDGTTTPTMLFRWRDDGYPKWSAFVELSLDPEYFGDFIIHLTRMGTYRSRQYEFRLSDEVDMALVSVVENVS